MTALSYANPQDRPLLRAIGEDLARAPRVAVHPQVMDHGGPNLGLTLASGRQVDLTLEIAWDAAKNVGHIAPNTVILGDGSQFAALEAKGLFNLLERGWTTPSRKSPRYSNPYRLLARSTRSWPGPS